MKRLISLGLIFIFLIFNIACFTSYADDSDDTIVVGVSAHRCPMFYIDDNGEITGIGVDLMNEVAKEASLNVVYKDITEHDLKQALDNPEYDVVMPFGSAIKSEEGNDIIISDDIINMPFTLLVLKANNLTNLEDITVGMLSSQKGVAETLKEFYPTMNVAYYDTTEEGIRKLRHGEVNALLNNAYIWSYVIQKPSYADLNVSSTILFSVDFRIGTLDTEEGRALINSLNKGIANISDTKRQSIILDYTSRKLYKFDLSDFLYVYGPAIIIGLVILSLVIGIFYIQNKLSKSRNAAYVKQLLTKDALTGAYSALGFKECASYLIKNCDKKHYALMYINIRDFKYLNNNLGKKASDDLLKFLVQQISSVLAEDEVVGRLESDHFVILSKITDTTSISHYDEIIFTPTRNYFTAKGRETIVQLCVGIYTLVEKDYTNIDLDHIIDKARLAEKNVSETKKEGYEFYNPTQWKKGKWLSDVVGHLEFALDNGEIQVFYQPQINYENGEVTGAEALCRWNHIKLGWISPGEFIPALEDAGYISKLDYYIWERVCQDLDKWNKEGRYKTVSINISRFDIKEDVDIVEHLINLVKKYKLDIKQLNIEITETAYVDNESLIGITQQLREKGFRVEMDDFGSGYSSLNMLKEIPIDRIKLDLRFLSKDTSDERGRIIIESLINMAKRLGIELIAEGVETEAQANMLKEVGCVDMQGYYFYKPMNVESFEQLHNNLEKAT